MLVYSNLLILLPFMPGYQCTADISITIWTSINTIIPYITWINNATEHTILLYIMCIYIYIYIERERERDMRVCMHIVYIYIYMCTYVCMCTHIHMYVYIYIHIHTCVCIHTYVYTHTYILWFAFGGRARDETGPSHTQRRLLDEESEF